MMKYVAGNLLLAVAVAGVLAWTMPVSMAAEPKPEPKAELKRTVLLRQDLDIPGREVVMVAVEIPPGVAEGLHSHPADLFSFVAQGEVVLELEGQPTKTYHAGDTLYVPAGKVHQGINRGNVAAKLSAVFVAQKGKPLTVPAK